MQRHRTGRRQRSWARWNGVAVTVVILVYAFVAAPLFPVFAKAFNSGPFYSTEFVGLSLRWFTDLWRWPEFRGGLLISLQLGVGAAVLSCTLAVLGALSVVRGPSWLRGSTMAAVLMGPVIVPQLVIGLALVQFLSDSGLRLGMTSLILAHGAFCMPFALRIIAAGVESQGILHEQAAMSLGARPLRVFTTVTLPLLRGSISAAAVLSFVLSFVNVPLSLFLAPSNLRPFPVTVFQAMLSGMNARFAALAVILTVVGVGTYVFVERVAKIRLL